MNGYVHTGYIFASSNGNLSSSTALSSRRYNGASAPVAGTTSLSASYFRPAIKFVGETPSDSNSCLNISTLNLTITNTPSVPQNLTGTVDICSIVGTSLSAIYYTDAIPGVSAYEWTLPSGAVLDSGSNGSQIKVRFASASPFDSIFVKSLGQGGCNSLRKGLALNTNGCATTPLYTKTMSAVNYDAGILEVKVFPNPTTNNFNLEVVTFDQQKIDINIYDVLGRLLFKDKILPNQIIKVGESLKTGAYLIEVRQGKKLKTTKALKF